MTTDAERGARKGWNFCTEITAACHEFGPPHMGSAEREQLAQHLIAAAIEWVEARDKAAENPQ